MKTQEIKEPEQQEIFLKIPQKNQAYISKGSPSQTQSLSVSMPNSGFGSKIGSPTNHQHNNTNSSTIHNLNFNSSQKHTAKPPIDQHKLTLIVPAYSFPNAVHMQMSQISGGTLPCITSKHIQSFDLNPLTKEIFLVTESELAIFDIEQNQFKAVRTFKQVLNQNVHMSNTLLGMGDQKMSINAMAGGFGLKDDKNSSQTQTANNSKPGTASAQVLTVAINKNQSFHKPVCLQLYNHWAIIKNSKQTLFLNSMLNFSKDTISDSNGIADLLVSQRSEEIVTITKDLKQIRIWTYLIYAKDRPMPPIDELPVNVNFVDPNLHVFLTNKKNIHLNLQLDQLCLNSVCELLMCSSLESNELAVFTLKEGKNLYSLEYRQEPVVIQANNINGNGANSSSQYNNAQDSNRNSRAGADSFSQNGYRVELIKSKYSHDQGYFTRANDQKISVMIKSHQEFMLIMNKRTFDLTVWDLGLEKLIKTVSLISICNLNPNQLGLQNFQSKAQSIIPIDFIYPNLSNFKSGFFIIDKQQNMYDISLHSQTIIQKLGNFKNLHHNHSQQQIHNYGSTGSNSRLNKNESIQQTFTSEVKTLRRGSMNLSAIQVKALTDVKSGFTPSNRNNVHNDALNVIQTQPSSPLLRTKTPRNLNASQISSYSHSFSNYFMRYLPNQDGTKALFILKEGSLTIEVITFYSNLDVIMERPSNGFKQLMDPCNFPIIIKDKTYNLLMPLIDENNHLNLLDIYESRPTCLFSVNLSELLSGSVKQIVEIPTLNEKHKPKKEIFINQPHTQRIFTFDVKSRIAVFIDEQGMCCIINTHFRTRKYVYIEDRLKIKDVFIMVNHENNTFYDQLKQKPCIILPFQPNNIVSDDEFSRKDNPYRLLDDFPDFDFLIAVVTFDGLIIIVQNESQFNEVRVSHRINIQTAIMQARYIQEKQKLMIIIKDGVLKMFDVFKDMQVVKSCQLMWPDITAIDLKSDEVLIAGHESGIIYTQQIKGEIKITEMQLHNYHLSPIQQVCLPKSGLPSKKFVAWSSNCILTLFSMDQDRPLRVMRFHDQFTRLMYLGKNEVIAFEKNYIFKIDLNDAQTFSEHTKRYKDEWINLIKQRIQRNQYVKKQLQVEEQRNEQFYQFQHHKQQMLKAFPSRDQCEPELFRFYMQLNNNMNIYNSLIQQELDFLLNPEGKGTLNIKQLIYLNEVQKILALDERYQQFILSKGSDKTSSNKKRKESTKVSMVNSNDKVNYLEQIEFQRKIRSINKINRQYKMNFLKINTDIVQTQEQSQQNSKSNSPTKISPTKSQQQDSLAYRTQMKKSNSSNIGSSINKDLKRVMDIKFNHQNQQSQIIQEEDKEEHSQNYQIQADESTEDVYNQPQRSQFSQFLQVVKQSQKQNQFLQTQQNFKIANKDLKPQTLELKQTHKRGLSIQSLKSDLGSKKSHDPNKEAFFITEYQTNNALKTMNNYQFALPTISMEQYSRELFTLKQKIQTFEERAQTAANQRLENKNFKFVIENSSLKNSQQYLKPQESFETYGLMQQQSKYQYLGGNYQVIQKNHSSSKYQSKPMTQDSVKRKTLLYKSQSEATLASQLSTVDIKTSSGGGGLDNDGQLRQQQTQHLFDNHSSKQLLAPSEQQLQSENEVNKLRNTLNTAGTMTSQSSTNTNTGNKRPRVFKSLHHHKVSYNSQYLNEQIPLHPLPVKQYQYPMTSQMQKRQNNQNAMASKKLATKYKSQASLKPKNILNSNEIYSENNILNTKQIPQQKPLSPNNPMTQMMSKSSTSTFFNIRLNQIYPDLNINNMIIMRNDRNSSQFSTLKSKTSQSQSQDQMQRLQEQQTTVQQNKQRGKIVRKEIKIESVDQEQSQDQVATSVNQITEESEIKEKLKDQQQNYLQNTASAEFKFRVDKRFFSEDALNKYMVKQALKPTVHNIKPKVDQWQLQQSKSMQMLILNKQQEEQAKLNQSQESPDNIKIEDNLAEAGETNEDIITQTNKNHKDKAKKKTKLSDYQIALKRFLQGDKSEQQTRINILEKKPELIVQERQKSPQSADGKHKDNDKSEKTKNELERKDTVDNDENNFLNEEERSIIVDEILKANNQDEIVLEDNSPDRRDQEDANDKGLINGQQQKQKEEQKNKFRVIIKNDKEKSRVNRSSSQNALHYSLPFHDKNGNRKKIETAFEDGVLSAHKMQIVKHSKREKHSQKYMILKELMRDKVTIQREEHGFQIIIPKTLQMGKANLKNIEVEDLVKNYAIYRINYKDILDLIKEKAGYKDGETVVDREQIAIFLKKNLRKLLKEQDPSFIQRDKDLQEKLHKMETIRSRRAHKEKERMLRQLMREEELQAKREKKNQEKLMNQEQMYSKKVLYIEELRKKYNFQQSSIYKMIPDSESQSSADRYPKTSSSRNGYNSAFSHKQSFGQNDVQMVYATELKIAERREEIRRRLDMLKMEKEQERMRVEKFQIFNFIKDQIVRGLIINKRVLRYIKDKDQSKLPPDQFRAFYFKENYDHAQSKYSQLTGSSLLNKLNKANSMLSNNSSQGGFNNSMGGKQYTLVESVSEESMRELNDDDSQNSVGKMGIKITKRFKKQFKNSLMGGDNKDIPDILITGEKSARSSNGKSRRTSRRPNQDIGILNIQRHTMTRHSSKMVGTGSRKSSDLNIDDIIQDTNVLGGLQLRQERSLSPNRSTGRRGGQGSKRGGKFEGISPMYSKQNKSSKYNKSTRRDFEEDYEEGVARYSEDANNQSLEDGTSHNMRQKSMYSRGDSPKKKANQDEDNSEENDDEYYEEGPNELNPLGSMVSKNSSSQYHHKQTLLKTPMRIQLISDNQKIKDYDLSSQQSSNPLNQGSYQPNNNLGPMSNDLYSILDSEADDYMTKEEEVLKINQELQYQRILEKITEKMMSKKISQFKKELLIRIALNLELMETPDLFALEELLERYELHDQEVKKQIIAMFQDKYQINLGVDLQTLVEEQMNKVKDETKATRRKNIKELLLKKIRMLNMISRFCRVGPSSQDQFKNAQNAQKRLKELLDEDDDDFYSDEEDIMFKQEFQETVQEVLSRIFSKDDKNVSVQLQNFKKNYKMRFGAQPEYLIKDDAESEIQSLQDQQAMLRVRAFKFNGMRLLDVLNSWLHPESLVLEDKIHTRKVKGRRKYLYDSNLEFTEENLFDTFYDLVQEVLKRMNKVQQNIKANDKILGASSHAKVHREEDISFNEDGSIKRKKKMVKKEYLNQEMLLKRRMMSDLELKERQYCALRIAEHLETNMQWPPQDIKVETTDTNDTQPSSDQTQPTTLIKIVNFLDPNQTHDKMIERESLSYMRHNKSGYQDPFIKIMSQAFRKFAQLMENDQ